jgi:hypothetical protein
MFLLYTSLINPSLRNINYSHVAATAYYASQASPRTLQIILVHDEIYACTDVSPLSNRTGLTDSNSAIKLSSRPSHKAFEHVLLIEPPAGWLACKILNPACQLLSQLDYWQVWRYSMTIPANSFSRAWPNAVSGLIQIMTYMKNADYAAQSTKGGFVNNQVNPTS